VKDGVSITPGSTVRIKMKVCNLYIYGDSEYLQRLEEEYTFMGRQVRVEDGRLIVFALPRKRKVNKDSKNKFRKR
jgi:hypothetical protein